MQFVNTKNYVFVAGGVLDRIAYLNGPTHHYFFIPEREMRWHQKVKFFWLASAAAAYGVWRGALISVLVVVGRVGGVFHPGTVLLLTTGIQHGSGVWQEGDQRVTSEEKKKKVYNTIMVFDADDMMKEALFI